MSHSPAQVIPSSALSLAAPALDATSPSAPPQPLDRGRAVAGIRPRPGAGRIPLSHAQERLWFLDQVLPERGLYNVYQAVRLRGALNVPALARAFDEIGRRHEVFRTRFLPGEEGPVQVIAGDSQLSLAETDLSGRAAAERAAALRELIRTESRRPFNLAGDRLIRAVLVRLAADEHVLLLVMHHIVSDGWTVGVLLRELAALHEAFAAGRPSPLPPLPVRFADFALWERETFQGEALERSLSYWRRQLAGAAMLDLPTDHPRPAEPSWRGATSARVVPAALGGRLRQLARAEKCTLFTVLLAGFQALLHRYSGQDDIVVGSCVAGRPQLELEHLAGFFVNTIVLRTSAGGQPRFRELLRRTRQTVMGAMNHQEVPFDRVVADLQPDRTAARNPFFQVMFVLQSAGGPLPESAGLAFEPVEADNGTAKFDLSFSLSEARDGSVGVSVEYRTDLYERATVERMLGHFQALLTGIAADPDQPVAGLPLLSAAEKRQLLEEWNGVRTAYPRDATVPELFREHAERAPGAVAIEWRYGQLGYGELDARSNRLARLLAARGVRPGDFVALCLERSPEVIVTLLAILKAGAAYVSLDAAYPAARLGLMIADAQPALLVLQEKFRPAVDAALAAAGDVAPAPVLLGLESEAGALAATAADPFAATATAGSLAYVSYTSGSTGRPKGVCIPQRGIVRLVRDTDYVELGPECVFLQFAPVAFDASTFEIWGPLLTGGRLVIADPGLPSLAELADTIRRHGVNTVFLTTGLFHQLIDEQAPRLTGLQQLLTGGEVLSPAHAARARALLPATRLLNVYGPTENTTFSTAHPLTVPPVPGRPIPIGRPIANTTVFVLDGARQPVPIGVPGELHTGGDGLAAGYLRRPELDAERFVPHPFEPGARLYRTGDRVRWLADGTLEFLGRVDRQVKLRGFRVEPGEIEAVLTRHPAVAQAAVFLDSSSAAGPRLVAWVTGRAGLPEVAPLRRHLEAELPAYLVPAVIMPVPELPLNANGKVDRAALPSPEAAPAADRPPYVAPRDDAEARLVAIWSGILGIDRVGVNDNFFQLGGHSMAGVRLFARIEREFGRRLPLASLFAHPTPAELAARLRAPDTGTTCSSLVALQPHGTRPPVFFFHGAGGGNLWTYANLIPHFGGDQPVYGLESRGMRGLAEFDRVEDMAAHYLREIRTVQPEGPYYLAGYCFGGNVAFELARQLEAGGERVAFLGLLDSAAANSSYQRLPWWRPEFYWRFAANTACWLADFSAQPARDQVRFIRRKARMAARRLFSRAGAREIEEVIDVSIFPEIELNLWRIHLDALSRYHPGRYGGRVVLFRTRGHPVLCSFDPLFGWSEFAAGGIELVRLPGAHEGIFMEPHVRALSTRFLHHLRLAQQRHRTAPALSS